jgi:dTDP-glucose pyrophosphorylase
MSVSLDQIILEPDTPIRQAIACMDQGRKGIVLIVDGEKRLQGTVVDGDIRRAILAGVDLNGPVSKILQHKTSSEPSNPISAPEGTSRQSVVDLMRKQMVRQIPLIDQDGRVVDLVTASDIVAEDEPGLQAMIMAGGYGTRMHPLTQDCPKPLLPVGDKPLLSHIINQLKQAGISRVNLSTFYLADQIRQYFGDGSEHGVELNYVTEDEPLGTAGALGLLEVPDQPLLIINGDILTQVDFRAMLQFHQEAGALLSVAVRKYELPVPFGVVESDGVEVTSLIEKPTYSLFVNAGIYLLEPKACLLVKEGERLDMPDLIQRLLAQGEKVVSFPIIEYWLDVGNPEDYQQAQDDVLKGTWRS